MPERLVIRCWEPAQAHQAITKQAWPLLKAHLMAGRRMVLELREEKRSLAENAMLHALLSQISHKVEWAGKKRDMETWKRLLTAAWLRARGEPVEMLPALDGHGIDVVFRRTSQLTRAECADLIEFVMAWAAENGVEMADQETGEVLL
jgi:NinB protein